MGESDTATKSEPPGLETKGDGTINKPRSHGPSSIQQPQRDRTQRWRNKNNGNNNGANKSAPASIDSFKGTISELRGKTFILRPTQASKYDKALKALLLYISNKFDHRVHRLFEEKIMSVGLALLQEPDASTKPKEDNAAKEVLDKDSVAWIKYQLTMKHYIEQESSLRDNM